MKELDNKTLAMRYIELTHERKIEDILHEKYILEEKSIREIAQELGVHYHTVNTWLKDLGISMRLPHAKLLDLVEIKRKLKENEENV